MESELKIEKERCQLSKQTDILFGDCAMGYAVRGICDKSLKSFVIKKDIGTPAMKVKESRLTRTSRGHRRACFLMSADV